MSLAIVYSRAQAGMEAPSVTVEVHLSNGLPSLSIVGLPEAAVRESKDRVRSAILNANFEFPARRITINLAPADLPKEGGRFDLPIALGILAASRQIPAGEFDLHEFVGELALSGKLLPVKGVLPTALQVRDSGRTLVIPNDNAGEAALVNNVPLVTGNHLLDITAHLSGQQPQTFTPTAATSQEGPLHPDLADVRGQAHARRALEIAAAGGHSLLMLGPPGTGKSMLASRLPGILPPMSDEEALQAATVRSVCGMPVNENNWKQRPFRAPHHTASAAALVGGGSTPRPGEISLAHNGVLFLDELPEFDRRVLEVLREPLESGHINISRAARQASFPARFQLVTAMNPCPCGWLGDASGKCRCTSEQVQKYRSRVSGPLLDRVDMHLEVPRLSYDELQKEKGEASTTVSQRVITTREVQIHRNNTLNSLLKTEQVNTTCFLGTKEHCLLKEAMEKLHLSARANHRILKLARTIADMEQAEAISARHLAEAISYRAMDRTL